MAPSFSRPTSELEESDDGHSEEHEQFRKMDPERVKALDKALDGQGKTKQSSEILKPYTFFARWYTRSEDLFANWYDILDKGFAFYVDAYGELDAETFSTKYKKELDTFTKMVIDIRCFNDDLPYFLNPKNVDRKDDLAKAMIAASGAARSEDISTLQHAIIIYINESDPDHKVIPEISPRMKKSDARGFKHPVLARLICPVKYLEEFDANPIRYMRKLDEEEVKVLSSDFPSFLWARGQYDPEDTDSEMLRSDLLAMVWKHIFTSPSSALKDKPGQTKTRSSQAKMHRMELVTPASIAYVCVLIRYSISGIEDWRIDDNLFDREEFYKNIVDLFKPDTEEGGDSEWRDDTLDWWNAKVLGKSPRWVKEPENLSGPSTISIIADQRRARKAAKAEVAKAEAAKAEAAKAEAAKAARAAREPLEANQGGDRGKRAIPHPVPSHSRHRARSPRHSRSPRRARSPRRSRSPHRARSPRRSRSLRRARSPRRSRSPGSLHARAPRRSHSPAAIPPSFNRHRRQSPSRSPSGTQVTRTQASRGSSSAYRQSPRQYRSPTRDSATRHPLRSRSPTHLTSNRHHNTSRERSHTKSTIKTLDFDVDNEIKVLDNDDDDMYLPERVTLRASSQTLREGNSSPVSISLTNKEPPRTQPSKPGRISRKTHIIISDDENSPGIVSSKPKPSVPQSSPARSLVLSESRYNRRSSVS